MIIWVINIIPQKIKNPFTNLAIIEVVSYYGTQPLPAMAIGRTQALYFILIVVHIAKASKTFGRFLRPLAIADCYELLSGEYSLTNKRIKIQSCLDHHGPSRVG